MKKNLLLWLAVCIPAFIFSQETVTRNITPVLQNASPSFTYIGSNASGTRVILGSDGIAAPLMVFRNDDLFWKDITKGIPVNTITMMAVSDYTTWVLGKSGNGQTTLCWLYDANLQWTKYDISQWVYGDIRGIAADRSGDIVVAGIFSAGANKYYGARYYDHNAKWVPLLSQKNDAAVLQWFETGKIQHMATSGKENVYVHINDPVHNSSAIIQWDGKKWFLLGEPLHDPPSSMIVDPKGNLYVAGNYQANNTDCLLKWDGKTWTSFPVPGFRSGMFKYLAMDKDNRLLVGGWHATMNKYQILVLNGSNWELYGEAPKFINKFTPGGEKIFAVGDVANKGVYLVPSGGRITEMTASAPGMKPDKYPAEVFAAWESYLVKAKAGLDVYAKDIVPAQTAASAKDAGTTIASATVKLLNQYLSPASNEFDYLKLTKGDNLFADLVRDAISYNYAYYDAIYTAAKESDNMFYGASDVARNKRIISEWDTLRNQALRKLHSQEDAYIAKHHITRRDLTADAKKANSSRPYTNISSIIEAHVKTEENAGLRYRSAFDELKSELAKLSSLSSLQTKLESAETESLKVLTTILQRPKDKLYDANPNETEQKLLVVFLDYINARSVIDRDILDFAKYVKNVAQPETDEEKKDAANAMNSYARKIMTGYQTLVKKASVLNAEWKLVNPGSNLVIALEK